MSADGARPPGAQAWWQCFIRGAAGVPDRLVTVQSARYPDGARIELEAAAADAQIGADAVGTATFGDDGRVVSLLVPRTYAPKAPPIWFAELRESAGRPPAVVLLAFTGAGQRPGSLVEQSDLSNIAVTGDDQLAALRWYPGSGEVDQVYVQPAWRRRNIGTALLAAGCTLNDARGWTSFWSDGQRTELGERLRDGSAWRTRTAERTHVAPPMTPAGSAA